MHTFPVEVAGAGTDTVHCRKGENWFSCKKPHMWAAETESQDQCGGERTERNVLEVGAATPKHLEDPNFHPTDIAVLGADHLDGDVGTIERVVRFDNLGPTTR